MRNSILGSSTSFLQKAGSTADASVAKNSHGNRSWQSKKSIQDLRQSLSLHGKIVIMNEMVASISYKMRNLDRRILLTSSLAILFLRTQYHVALCFRLRFCSLYSIMAHFSCAANVQDSPRHSIQLAICHGATWYTSVVAVPFPLAWSTRLTSHNHGTSENHSCANASLAESPSGVDVHHRYDKILEVRFNFLP
jgi:hypothetical protein